MTTELTTGQEPIPGRKDVLVNDILIVASDATELLKEKLDAAGASLGEAGTVLTEKVKYAAASGTDYVKSHPWKVLGLATVVGVIVGIFTYRR